MPGDPPARFEREMGCTEAEWLQWLPAAVGGRPLGLESGRAVVRLEDGTLELRWRALPPRVIALLRIPRLQVAFAFEGVGGARRAEFMRHFDLFTQRGGG
ncbi:MAG TPA: hypothetical protein VFX50_10215 [Gemmatimonadales bacterium]|nr:hypothetical protein [Gemmatimonadales bacterium]